MHDTMAQKFWCLNCRIIAAASNSPGVVSPEAKGTVSADGVPEISNPSTQTVTSEAAVTEEGKKEDPSPVGKWLGRDRHLINI